MESIFHAFFMSIINDKLSSFYSLSQKFMDIYFSAKDEAIMPIGCGAELHHPISFLHLSVTLFCIIY